jgi:hypothetical protein
MKTVVQNRHVYAENHENWLQVSKVMETHSSYIKLQQNIQITHTYFAYFIDPDGSLISDKRITEQSIVFGSVSDMLKNVPNYDNYISYALVSCAIMFLITPTWCNLDNAYSMGYN